MSTLRHRFHLGQLLFLLVSFVVSIVIVVQILVLGST
jgi:hypothetical protein